MLVHTSIIALLATLVTAAPTATLKERSSETCEQYGEIETAGFTVYNDLWGEGDASSGSQCTTVQSASGDTISWSTSWTWTGGTSIKSFANAGLTFTATQLSRISSIDTTWKWSYTGNNMVADVAYDTFLSSSPGGSADYEVMIWLDAIGGAKAISSTYNSAGQPIVIATTSIGEIGWDLYRGPNGDTTVYSFVPADGYAHTNFGGNLLQFYQYLINEQGVSSSQYLITLEAGTEATSGSDAVFTVSSYSVSLVA